MFRGAALKQIGHCALVERRGQPLGIRSPHRTASTTVRGQSLADCCATSGLDALDRRREDCVEGLDYASGAEPRIMFTVFPKSAKLCSHS